MQACFPWNLISSVEVGDAHYKNNFVTNLHITENSAQQKLLLHNEKQNNCMPTFSNTLYKKVMSKDFVV